VIFVCPGYTKTDFTGNNGGSIEEAGKGIVKYALIGEVGPTGKFFNEESNPVTEEIPWQEPFYLGALHLGNIHAR
jgi:hypothetical protein